MDLIKITQKAIDLNQLEDLFMGKNGYEWTYQELKHMPVKTNVDTS